MIPQYDIEIVKNDVTIHFSEELWVIFFFTLK